MYELYTDGGVSRNPGGTATYGFILYEGGKELSWGNGIVGFGAKMNNVMAEHYAISQGLSAFFRFWNKPAESLSIYNDSQYVVSQVWKDRILGHQLTHLNQSLDVKVIWIPRQNNLADRLTHLDNFRLPKAYLKSKEITCLL
jgi:ribonuclease HI